MSKLKWRLFEVPGLTGIGGWNAKDNLRSYVISHESRSGPGFEDYTGFTASWRLLIATSGRNVIEGSPFKTLDGAKAAVERKAKELRNAH